MKKMLKKAMKKIANHLIRESIVFESYPFFSDNTKPVYEELVKRGYEKKYNFIWYIAQDKCATIKNGKIVFWNPALRKTLREKIRNYSYYRTKCIVCCNKFLPSYSSYREETKSDQTSFYLTHGTPMKSTKEYYYAPSGIDYAISPSPAINQVISTEFRIPESKVFATGFPRNDAFSKPSKNLNQVFGGSYNKIIIWYPTYRQNKRHSIELSGNSLPLIHEEKNARLLNDIAAKNNILIVLKPHFAQDISLIKKINLSNIVLIDDDFFVNNGITSYELLAASDALITDYSSVYFDYTLRDRPIAVIWEDFEEYSKFPGFALDVSYYLKGAEKIYSINQLCTFVTEVAQNDDVNKNERREIRDICNIATDGQNTQRVVDFIIEKAKL